MTTRYNSWTVLSKTQHTNPSGEYLWKVQCDCGDVHYRALSLLKSGATKRCRPCANERHSKLLTGRRKHTDASKVARDSLNRIYKRHAKRRGLEFKLTPEQFARLTKKSCHYCGVKPAQVYNRPTSTYTYNGIDRVDNTEGYTQDNCVPCCGDCNKAKGTRTQAEFYEWVRAIYDEHVWEPTYYYG